MEPAQETRTKNQFTLISRRKVQSAKILGKDEQGLGARYDYFFFCFPFRNREIKEAWRKEQRNYFANE